MTPEGMELATVFPKIAKRPRAPQDPRPGPRHGRRADDPRSLSADRGPLNGTRAWRDIKISL